MKNETTIGVLALAGLGALWMWNRSKSEGGESPVKIGRIETSTTTQASSTDILSQAVGLATANEDEAIATFRADVKNRGLRVSSCELISGARWCTLSNGWKLPSWLVIDYLGMSEP